MNFKPKDKILVTTQYNDYHNKCDFISIAIVLSVDKYVSDLSKKVVNITRRQEYVPIIKAICEHNEDIGNVLAKDYITVVRVTDWILSNDRINSIENCNDNKCSVSETSIHSINDNEYIVSLYKKDWCRPLTKKELFEAQLRGRFIESVNTGKQNAIFDSDSWHYAYSDSLRCVTGFNDSVGNCNRCPVSEASIRSIIDIETESP